MSVRLIESDDGFQQELEAAGVRLVVVNFICKRYTTSAALESQFEQLSNKYPRAIFLKVDIDRCKKTALTQCVAIPTLFFYRNKTKIDHLQNANLTEFEVKIQLHIGSDNADSGEDLEQGLMDLKGLITKNQCECLGGTISHDFPLEHVFTDDSNYLNSYCDEQLILSVNFNQSVKIHAIKLKAPEELGPKTLKLFINQVGTMDFEQAESCPAVQEVIVDPKDLVGNLINLPPVKFAIVNSIQIFIKNNQRGSESTQLGYIGFIGSPLPADNNSISTDVDIEGIKKHKQKIISLLNSKGGLNEADLNNCRETGYSPNTLLELYKKRHELLSITHNSDLFARHRPTASFRCSYGKKESH